MDEIVGGRYNCDDSDNHVPYILRVLVAGRTWYKALCDCPVYLLSYLLTRLLLLSLTMFIYTRATVLRPFVRVYPGEWYQKKHPSTHPLLLINHPYHLPPSTTNHSIILAQSTYLAISLHNF